MTELKISVYCSFCQNKHEAKIELPEGWAHSCGGIDDEENGFCPDHADIAQFAGTQCPGCVGGWGDCDMWRAFAFPGSRRDITEQDIAQIEKGICPRRTNGTFGAVFSYGKGSCGPIDLSENAGTEAGKAFADAIREYIQRYP